MHVIVPVIHDALSATAGRQDNKLSTAALSPQWIDRCQSVVLSVEMSACCCDARRTTDRRRKLVYYFVAYLPAVCLAFWLWKSPPYSEKPM